MPNVAGTAQSQFIPALRTAKNRLEYLTENDWLLIIDRSKQMTFAKGEKLLHRGQQTKLVYLLAQGKANVESPSQVTIGIINPGEIAGEMSFLESAPASATVTAAEDVTAFAIDWTALKDLFELFPHLASRFYRSLALNLSRRLRDQISKK